MNPSQGPGATSLASTNGTSTARSQHRTTSIWRHHTRTLPLRKREASNLLLTALPHVSSVLCRWILLNLAPGVPGNGQTMMRSELIPQTKSNLGTGQLFYHFSVKHTGTNAPIVSPKAVLSWSSADYSLRIRLRPSTKLCSLSLTSPRYVPFH
jgi:hypothetical protein